MNPLRSVGTRLSVALLLVVAGSLTLVYLVVIPSLQSRLIDSKIAQLRKSVPGLRDLYGQDTDTQFFARDAAATVDARVVVFNYFSTEPSLTLAVQQDSRGLTPSNDVANDAVALRAATSGMPASKAATGTTSLAARTIRY